MAVILRRGSTGNEVKRLQDALKGAGYDVGATDGIFGSKTESKLKEYQKANGLAVDGIAGEKTWGSLNSSANNTLSPEGNTQGGEPEGNTQGGEPKYKVNGVDDELINYDGFSASDAWKEADNKRGEIGSNIEGIVGKANEGKLVDSGTWDTINSSFSPSSSYNKAWLYTNNLLEKLSSGRTSYSDDVESMMRKIMNREDFEYDVGKDPLFQQALASSMNSGKIAMQDTIGQASALTGGYGSTYATSAGNQAYNAFIEDAYDNLPEYYQMALQAYQMEGEEMFNQLGMFVDADNREYQRTYDAWGANFANADSMYNKEYGAWQDSVNNAFQSANLQINEFGTTLDANSVLYGLYKDDADTIYQREYQTWADDVLKKTNIANLLHSDYWANKEFDEGVRRFDKSYALDQASLSFRSSGGGGGGSGSGGGSGGGLEDIIGDIPKDITTRVSKMDTDEERANYLDNMEQQGYITPEQADYLYSINTGNEKMELSDRKWTVADKGGLNWGGGIDNNAKVTDQYGTTYRMDDLFKEIAKTKGEDAAKKYIIKLQKDLGI